MIKYTYEIICDGYMDYYVNRIRVVTAWGVKIFADRCDFINQKKKWCRDSCDCHYTFDSIDAAKAGIEVANYKEKLDGETEAKNDKLRGGVILLDETLKDTR